MSLPVPPAPQGAQPASGAAPSSADTTTAAAIATSEQGYTAATKINSMAQLRETAPKLYNAMLQGIAMKICHDMQEHIERFRKLMRDGYRR